MKIVSVVFQGRLHCSEVVVPGSLELGIFEVLNRVQVGSGLRQVCLEDQQDPEGLQSGKSVTQTSACAGVEVPVVQGLRGFDRSPEGHVDPLEDPCHEALWGHQDVGQSGDEAQEVLAPVDDATTPGSDSCAVPHLLGSGVVQVCSYSVGCLGGLPWALVEELLV